MAVIELRAGVAEQLIAGASSEPSIEWLQRLG